MFAGDITAPGIWLNFVGFLLASVERFGFGENVVVESLRLAHNHLTIL
jgi:hypothetical protein